MAITDPRAITFCNEVVRPLSRRIENLLADIEDAKDRWDDDISALVPNDPAEKVADGRVQSEGAPELDGEEVVRFMRRLRDILDLANGVAVTPTGQFRRHVTRPNPTTLRRNLA